MGDLSLEPCKVLTDEVPLTLCQYLLENKFFNLFVCFASFVAQDVGDLSLTQGDIIIAVTRVNDHWMQGQVCYDGQSNSWPKLDLGRQLGTFPLNHCTPLDSNCIELFCRHRIDNNSQRLKDSPSWSSMIDQQLSKQAHSNHIEVDTSNAKRIPFLSTIQCSSISSCSSSAHSSNDNQLNLHAKHFKNHDATDNSGHNGANYNFQNNHLGLANYKKITDCKPPRPAQLPMKQISTKSLTSVGQCQRSTSEQTVAVVGPPRTNGSSIITSKQQDKIKGWLHTVRKKTARLSTRITASLGLISLTRDEEFERYYESFKHLEKTIRIFIKNISAFIEHFESFLIALQHTSDNLSEFYRDKTLNQREIAEMKRKNKALQCEHFHAFKRTVERQVIAVASQLLQKFSGPHQLIHKRTAKLLDFDTKTKEMESCRDLEKKAALRDHYVIAKELYERLNGQLLHELPLFNQFALDIFRECILVLLECRRNLILSYTKQTASLLDTPLMSSYTASDVASTIMMACNDQTVVSQQESKNATVCAANNNLHVPPDIRIVLDDENPEGNHQISIGTHPNSGGSSGGDAPFSDDTSASRPHSAMSQLSSDFDQIAGMVPREISSTPLSHVSGAPEVAPNSDPFVAVASLDEPDAIPGVGEQTGTHRARMNISRTSSTVSSDNRHNEHIESRIEAARSKSPYVCFQAAIESPPEPPKCQVVADSDLEELQQLRNRLEVDENKQEAKSKKKGKKSYPVYIASWPFVATGPNQLTIACNQQLRLVKDCDESGNSDWSLVRNRRNQIGYVPTSYIKRR